MPHEDPQQNPLPLYQVLEEEYVSLHGPLPAEHYKNNPNPEDRLRAIYKLIHNLKPGRAALCISGGGIRSATFALGIMQGLARCGLLDKFDYLSTVSGGGYIGSWLTSWIHREPGGAKAVFNKLKNTTRSALNPEPRPITHLRAYSNYLSPKLGLMSTDTWTLIAIITRNLILNWTVFIPLMAAVLLIPRFYVWLAGLSLGAEFLEVGFPIVLGLSFICGVISVVYIGLHRPSMNHYVRNHSEPDDTQESFLKWCLLPLISFIILLTIYWSWFRILDTNKKPELSPILGISLEYPRAFILFGILLYFIAWLVYSILLRLFSLRELGGAVIVGLFGGLFLWWAAEKVFPNPTGIPWLEIFACFAVPLLLALFVLAVTLFVGLASSFTNEEDREWLARFSAWALIVAVAWGVISAIVIFGPSGILWFENKTRVLIASAGGISGVITAVLGRSALTAANNTQEAEKKPSTWRQILLAIAAPFFVLVFLVALSLGTSALIMLFRSALVENSSFAGWHLDDLPSSLSTYTDNLEVIHNSSKWVLLSLLIGFVTIGVLMAMRVNINKFSLHSMYRNRLIRAYLGASREKRRPNLFTGFDPDDDVLMHELRPELFHVSSFKDTTRFTRKLKNPTDSDLVSQHLRSRLTPDTRQLLDVYDPSDPPSDRLLKALIEDLNEVLDGQSIYDKERFEAFELSEEIENLLKQSLDGNRLAVLNRLLLEAAYPDDIENFRSYKPLHVVNMALNLVKGENLAWQERKAETFSVSPLHSGSFAVNEREAGQEGNAKHRYGSYRRSREYGNAKKYESVDGISLGTAVAISGAAVSPNMGYHSSSAITFLLTLFNARLGWWLGNPGKPGADTYRRPGPFFAARPLIAEAFGLTNDKNRYVYLSDGGHFENLGFYEMVLRRCKYIVISDGSQDPEGAFDDLGAAIRKVRIDLGVGIDMEEVLILPRKNDGKGKFCAIGTIHYEHVDEGGKPGTLIYIKPAICGKEPRDVFNYAQKSKLFPHESTADQYFSESQFESYRVLGLHAIEQICKGWDRKGIKDDEYLEKFQDHVKTKYLADDSKSSISTSNQEASELPKVVDLNSPVVEKPCLE